MKRNDDPLPPLSLSAKDDEWKLDCEQPDWLENNKLLHADLQTEQEYWREVGWNLHF